MKKYLFIALASIFALASCDNKETKTPNPGETNSYAIDATSSTTWTYFSLTEGKKVGTGEETETDNATWAARKDWDFAVNRYHVRTNSGKATSAGAQGGVYICPESNSFASIAKVPEDAVFAIDKAITSSGMGGETTVVKSEATVILFKKNADGSSVMPPVYLYAPVCIIRSADGSRYFKVFFTQYKSAENVTGMVEFDMAEIYK